MNRRHVSFLFLALWATLLTALTGVLGGIPLRAYRVLAGGWVYWMTLLLTALALLAFKVVWLALLLLSAGLVIGLYSEFEEREHGLVPAATAAVLISASLIGGCAALWAGQSAVNWYAAAVAFVDTQLAAMPGWATQARVEAKDIVHQLPSVVLIALSLTLFVGLLFERRLLASLRVRAQGRSDLASFRSPEFMVWVFIGGLAAAFLAKDNVWIKAAGVNLLNVSVVVFFFQGLAVIVKYLEAFRVGLFWRLVSLVLLVTQLFLVASSIGLADYWFDFRNRLAGRTQQTDTSTNT